VDNNTIDPENRELLSSLCERAFLVGIRDSGETALQAEAHLNELEGLVASLGIPSVGSILATLKELKSRTLIGKGKVEEIGAGITDLEADLVVFDADLSPAQQRNLEKDWGVPVIDRREVILDIFGDRASTREAVIQVALARMQYSLPRLTRAWTHLSRQRGGAKGNRGKGETQLEYDRRIVQDRIAILKKDLAKVRDQRDVRRKRRIDKAPPSVSLVGYTNAGKSSLMNAISGSDLLVEDKLFATLDPTTRRIEQAGGREILLTDTVGFIRKLPHDLVDAFRSTLEEAVLSDVILHVADASSPELDDHLKVTETVLRELGAGNKTRILALNKIDMLSPEHRESLAYRYPSGIPVSARSGEGLEDIMAAVSRALDADRPLVTVVLPPDRWDLRARLHQDSNVVEESYEERGVRLLVRMSADEKGRFADFLVDVQPDPIEPIL
jgi:GTP-binding protein HflX